MVDPAASALAIAGKVATPRALYKQISKLADANTATADAAFRELLDELTLAMAARFDWDEFPEDERPSDDDVRKAAEAFKNEYESASGNPKRKLLFSAFFQSFNPRFYCEGLSRILWGYVVQLEYPDVVYIRDVIDGFASRGLRDEDRLDPAFFVPEASRDWLSYTRLKRLDLMAPAARQDGVLAGEQTENVQISYGICRLIMEFCWSDQPDRT